MKIDFQGQLTRAHVPAYQGKTANDILRLHLGLLVKTMQEVVSKPGPSPPGQPPGLQTGRLRDSIKLYDRSHGQEAVFQVAVEAPYADYLEWGTKHMARRPFMLKTYNAFKSVNIGKLFVELINSLRGRIFSMTTKEARELAQLLRDWATSQSRK